MLQLWRIPSIESCRVDFWRNGTFVFEKLLALSSSFWWIYLQGSWSCLNLKNWAPLAPNRSRRCFFRSIPVSYWKSRSFSSKSGSRMEHHRTKWRSQSHLWLEDACQRPAVWHHQRNSPIAPRKSFPNLKIHGHLHQGPPTQDDISQLSSDFGGGKGCRLRTWRLM